MAELPYTVLSCALSLDGYLDDASGERLVLSGAADLDRVDALRASCDAILVGAATVRADNPRLLVRSPERQARRMASGHPASPTKVTLTRDGLLDPQSAFFTAGESERLIYCATAAVHDTHERLGALAVVVDAGPRPTMRAISADLGRRGVRRLLVEGGQQVLTQFLLAALADELQVVIAPLFVGDSQAPRFVSDGAFPWHREHRARLTQVHQVGDVALLRYALSERFAHHDTSGAMP